MKWQRVKYQPNTPLGANGQKVTASKAHTELSKQAAKEGMVLLKMRTVFFHLRREQDLPYSERQVQIM